MSDSPGNDVPMITPGGDAQLDASHKIQPNEVLRTDSVATHHDVAGGTEGNSRKRKAGATLGPLDAKLIAKAVRAQLRRTETPAAVSRKELRDALERQLGCDLAEWKGAIKEAAVAFIAA